MSKQVKDRAGRMIGQKAFSVIMALVIVIAMVGMAGCGKTTTSTPPANNPASADGQVLNIDGGFYKLSKDGSGYTAVLVGTNKAATAAKTAYANGGNVNGSEITATFATYTTTTTATATAPTPTFELLGSFNIGPGGGWYYIPDGHVTIEVGDGTPTPATPDTPPADVTTVPVVGIIDEPDDEFDFDGTDGVLVPGLPDDAVIDAPVTVITDIDEAIDEIIANLPEDFDPAVVEDNFKDWLGPVCPPTVYAKVKDYFGDGTLPKPGPGDDPNDPYFSISIYSELIDLGNSIIDEWLADAADDGNVVIASGQEVPIKAQIEGTIVGVERILVDWDGHLDTLRSNHPEVESIPDSAKYKQETEKRLERLKEILASL